MAKTGQAFWTIHSDGAAKGNPGPAGAGWLIRDGQGKVLSRTGRYLGRGTNNEAEYQALIGALEEALALGGKDVTVHSDSELLVRQLNGQYRVRHPRLKELFDRVQDLLSRFREYVILHVPREQNREADAMANEAVKAHRPS
ncbi:MAG: ribonuclease HI family protein [Desulfobacterota bacterium]|jgi:ribonuclease HI|nr:ribonuclease HI family protein [Thermodesulfobacteriota bacterium]